MAIFHCLFVQQVRHTNAGTGVGSKASAHGSLGCVDVGRGLPLQLPIVFQATLPSSYTLAHMFPIAAAAKEDEWNVTKLRYNNVRAAYQRFFLYDYQYLPTHLLLPGYMAGYIAAYLCRFFSN